MTMDGAVQLRIDRVHADMARTLRDVDAVAAGEPGAADALRGRLRTALAELSALAHEPVVLAWLASAAQFWVVGQVPWTSLAGALGAPGARPVSQAALEKTFDTVFAGLAPARRPAKGRGMGSGYSVIGMWAAITEWHLAVGLPVPAESWRAYGDVAALLNLFPVIADHPETAVRGSRPVQVVRAAGHRVPVMLEPLVTEAARHHHDTIRRWVAHTRHAPGAEPTGLTGPHQDGQIASRAAVAKGDEGSSRARG
ncbi:hypothetical protein [Amycolatopsis sp. NPDC004378]